MTAVLQVSAMVSAVALRADQVRASRWMRRPLLEGVIAPCLRGANEAAVRSGSRRGVARQSLLLNPSLPGPDGLESRDCNQGSRRLREIACVATQTRRMKASTKEGRRTSLKAAAARWGRSYPTLPHTVRAASWLTPSGPCLTAKGSTHSLPQSLRVPAAVWPADIRTKKKGAVNRRP